MFILDTFLSQRPIKQFHLTVSGPKRESILKGPCDCFHMVGQHGDKHDELRPRSIWLVPQYCPSTAVILHPNIWVIARYAWELSAPPILGIPHWQHASNSSAAPPSLHSHLSHTPPPTPPFETLSHSRVLLRHLPFPVSAVVAQRGERTVFRRGEGESGAARAGCSALPG